jgi:hypothetical protein
MRRRRGDYSELTGISFVDLDGIDLDQLATEEAA